MSSLYWIRVLVSISIYINFLLYQLSTAVHRLIPNTSFIFQATCNSRYQVPNHFFHNMIGNPTVNDIHLCYFLWMQGNNEKCKACKSKGQIVAIKDQFFFSYNAEIYGLQLSHLHNRGSLQTITTNAFFYETFTRYSNFYIILFNPDLTIKTAPTHFLKCLWNQVYSRNSTIWRLSQFISEFHTGFKVIHKDVKPFLNETVKKIIFHVDL